jgi:hypothetical protein
MPGHCWCRRCHFSHDATSAVATAVPQEFLQKNPVTAKKNPATSPKPRFCEKLLRKTQGKK